MAVGIISIILLGIKRFRKINRLLKTETQIAQLMGLERFFDQATVHRFLNESQLWHLRQLEKVGDELAKNFGEAFRQDIVVLDIDSTTHSVESRQRQRAVIGYNKKNRGEAVAHKLYSGNTTCKGHMKDTLEMVTEKIAQPVSIVF